jgi:polysaccharide export outer membrane protein
LLAVTVFGLVVFAPLKIDAQVPVTDTLAKAAAALDNKEDTRYRIGAGDVIAIIVRKAPELSLEAVRVDQRGMIRIPMIDHEIQAACRTESELSSNVATLYLEYKRSPSVDVFVRDFQSRPVAVIGAVNSPGQFRLQRQVRLLELLSAAGGPSNAAGRVINIIHTGGPDLCSAEGKAEAPIASVAGLGVLRLDETMKGTEGSNPFVKPGDIISLPEADQVFVYGHVNSPRAIPLKDKPITISRAVAIAGGPARDARTSKVRIIRQGNGEDKHEIIVDLGAIEKRRMPDILLMPNDIVDVPSSIGKTILTALTGAIAPAISNVPIRAIP